MERCIGISATVRSSPVALARQKASPTRSELVAAHMDKVFLTVVPVSIAAVFIGGVPGAVLCGVWILVVAFVSYMPVVSVERGDRPRA